MGQEEGEEPAPPSQWSEVNFISCSKIRKNIHLWDSSRAFPFIWPWYIPASMPASANDLNIYLKQYQEKIKTKEKSAVDADRQNLDNEKCKQEQIDHQLLTKHDDKKPISNQLKRNWTRCNERSGTNYTRRMLNATTISFLPYLWRHT